MLNIQNINVQSYSLSNDQFAVNTFWPPQDVKWMRHALQLAQRGADLGEVPVGAVLVQNQTIIGQGFNQPISRHDATAHAEIVALREACEHLKNYRLLPQTTLYVTLEPCTMCVGAMIHARVDRLVYAASEPRAGMVGSQMNLPIQPFYNHNIQIHKGLCSEHSSQMLKTFFRQRRQVLKANKDNMKQKKDIALDASGEDVFLL